MYTCVCVYLYIHINIHSTHIYYVNANFYFGCEIITIYKFDSTICFFFVFFLDFSPSFFASEAVNIVIQSYFYDSDGVWQTSLKTKKALKSFNISQISVYFSFKHLFLL